MLCSRTEGSSPPEEDLCRFLANNAKGLLTYGVFGPYENSWLWLSWVIGSITLLAFLPRGFVCQKREYESMREKHMLRALEISKLALPDCIPNPPVGCVLVRDDSVVSEGFTQAIGGHHAEVQALNAYKGDMKGIVVYVTLEPCSFVGRTPACAKRLVESGVEHVVVSLLDPDPRNNGRGIQILEQAGILVEIGLCSEQVGAFLKPYLGKS